MAFSPIQLILASQSPRRRRLLKEAGYDFKVILPSDSAECGICSRETPPELVARLAKQKAADVAQRVAEGIILGCDTVADCDGRILGKPVDCDHAKAMLELLNGRMHRVYSGVCLWGAPEGRTLVKVAETTLQMENLDRQEIESYLQTGLWEGKAGAFGYQDRHQWLRILSGSESNVVGLPLELLAEMLEEFAQDRKRED